MPYKSEKIPLKPEQDRRRKYSEEDYENVKKLHLSGNSIRSIARETGISRRMIQFILYPERREENVKGRKNKDYYNKEAHREAIKSTRRYKQDLYLKGELKENDHDNR